MTSDMRRFARNLLLGFAVMVLTLIAMLLLPQREDIRWQAVRTEAFARFGWIYQRIHDDPTPIDIAFIGTSHTMMGIDTPLLQQELADAGLRTSGGRCVQLVNFAIPAYGRDMHWLLARELLENRRVKMLVVEVFENETRKAHPLFAHIAGIRDILIAPVLVNLNYFHNLIRLPFRQVSLAVKSLLPGSFGLKTRFDPRDYDGSDVDNTQIINVDGAALSPLRDGVMNPQALEAASQRNLAAKNPHMLLPWAEAYEYAVPDHYLTALLDLARAKGTQIEFLYLPQYGMPDRPTDDRLYRGRGNWLYVNDVLRREDYWFDESHLNAQGALAVTGRVGDDLAAQLKSVFRRELPGGESFAFPLAPAACGPAAYPPRAALKPFKPGHRDIDQAEGP